MNIAIAFLAGLLTFFTPCVFPLIPSYLSYIAGCSIEDLSGGDRKLLMEKCVYGSIYFILGFTVIFVTLGVLASVAGNLLYGLQTYLRLVGGVLIIIFGLMLTGIIHFGFLEQEHRPFLKDKPAGYLGAFFFGMTFAAGWVPCVGPLLSAILLIASTAGSRFFGGILLFFFCLGLGLPILISAVAFNYFLSFYKNIVRYLGVIQIVSGVILILIGILLITDNLTLITSYFTRLLS